MSNPLRGEVDLGKYKLVFDANAFCSIQSAMGMRVNEFTSAFSDFPDDLMVARGLLWGGLQKHHACHLIEAGEVMADIGMDDVRDAIARGLAAAFGIKAEGEESPNPPIESETPGTGSPSTKRTAKRAVAA